MGCDRAGCIGGFGCSLFVVTSLLVFALIRGNAEHWLQSEEAWKLLLIPMIAMLVTIATVKLFVTQWDKDCQREAKDKHGDLE